MRTKSFCFVGIGLALLYACTQAQENKSAAPIGNPVADVEGNVY
jgi:hypothetical protein